MNMKTNSKKIEFDYKKIKTFKNACKILKLDPWNLPEVSSIPDKYRQSVIAGYKLRIIFEAINNGWLPEWGNKIQLKYFPWFVIGSSGFTIEGTGTSIDYTHTSVGTLFCTDTREKAIYIAEQFKQEYQEYLLLSNTIANLKPEILFSI